MTPLLRIVALATLVAFAGSALALGPDDPGSPCRPTCDPGSPLLRADDAPRAPVPSHAGPP